MTVWEIAVFAIKQGQEFTFETTVLASIPLFERQEGCLDFQMLRSVDDPTRFTLLIEWESIAHHTEIFASTEDFKTFIDSVTPFLAADAMVDHAERFVGGF